MTLRVTEAFRGVRGPTVTLYGGGSMADFRFEVGRKYFIYAYGDPAKQVFGGVSICDRTRPLKDAGQELAYARSVRNATAGGRIFGTAGRSSEWMSCMGGPCPVALPATGSVVTARGPGDTAESTVDARGNFEIRDVPPGKYDVSVAFPAEWEADPETARVFTGSCFELNFRPRPSASISGLLLPTTGALPRFSRVSLIPVGTKENDVLFKEVGDYPDKGTGAFQIKGLQPGFYHLGLNLRDDPNADSPYPKTYYPGVQDRSKATIIEVKPAVKLTGMDIRLPSPLIERNIEVQVLWSDGRPARGGYAYLRSPDHPDSTVDPKGVSPLDADAKVVLKGFKGYVYDVIGTIACIAGGADGRDSKPLRVPDAPERPTLKVVLEGAFCEHYPNGR